MAQSKPSGRHGLQDPIEALEAIPNLPRALLVERWTEIYRNPPPKGISRRLLEYAYAYLLQVQAYGGLKPAARRKLQQLAQLSDSDIPPATAAKSRALSPGSRLVREWHGQTHIVDVLESGFQCGDRHYRSLSEVARTITGARWSGPRFFGL